MAELSVGDVVGDRYRVTKILGSGTYGSVYSATDMRIGRTVALKVLHANLVASEEEAKRFHREAKRVGNLEHPNIVGLYDYDDDDERAWMVMKYVPGGDAHSMVHGPTGMTEEVAVHISERIADALDYAHTKQILHRDVKPSNILLGPVDHRSQLPGVYLADFGIAKYLAESSRLTERGLVLATPTYAAPEVRIGEDASPRSDQYSLAVTAYEFLSASWPFGGDQSALRARYLNDIDPAPIHLGGRASPRSKQLDEVFKRALAISPEDRYSSCTQFAQAVRDVLAQPDSDGGAPPFGTASPTLPPEPPTGSGKASGLQEDDQPDNGDGAIYVPDDWESWGKPIIEEPPTKRPPTGGRTGGGQTTGSRGAAGGRKGGRRGPSKKQPPASTATKQKLVRAVGILAVLGLIGGATYLGVSHDDQSSGSEASGPTLITSLPPQGDGATQTVQAASPLAPLITGVYRWSVTPLNDPQIEVVIQPDLGNNSSGPITLDRTQLRLLATEDGFQADKWVPPGGSTTAGRPQLVTTAAGQRVWSIPMNTTGSYDTLPNGNISWATLFKDGADQASWVIPPGRAATKSWQLAYSFAATKPGALYVLGFGIVDLQAGKVVSFTPSSDWPKDPVCVCEWW